MWVPLQLRIFYDAGEYMDKTAKGQNPFILRFAKKTPIPFLYGLFECCYRNLLWKYLGKIVAPKSHKVPAVHLTTVLEEHNAASQKHGQGKPGKTHNPRRTPRSSYRYQPATQQGSACRLPALWVQTAQLAPCRVWLGSSAEAQHCLIRSGSITNTFMGHQACSKKD